MANVSIIDTGYIKPDNTGTRLSTSYMANSGNTMLLKGVAINISTKSNMDNSPTLNTFTPSEVNLCSVENRTIKITGIIKSDNTTDQGYMYELMRLAETIGYKSVFYNSTSSTDEFERQLINLASGGHTFTVSEVSTFGLSAQYKVLHCRFQSFDVAQNSGSPIIQWSLTGIILKNEG